MNEEAALRKVAVYSDLGSSPWCVSCTCTTLNLHSYTPVTLTSDDVISNTWTRECVGIVFPGGADSPYQEKLQGEGNRVIRQFVEKGGWYLGFCAGGYYGSSHIEFSKGDPVMEIIADRDLGFFPGTAVGPRYEGFSYHDNSGERVVSVNRHKATQYSRSTSNTSNHSNSLTNCHIYYNGGCTFSPRKSDVSHCEVLWSYNKPSDLEQSCDYVENSNENAAARSFEEKYPDSSEEEWSDDSAVVGCRIGRGRAVLSGIHPEVGYCDLNNSLHLPSVISEMKEHENERQGVLNTIFDFLDG